MKTQNLPSKVPDDLCITDIAQILYRQWDNTPGVDFYQMWRVYLSSGPLDKRYVFQGPQYLMMGYAEDNCWHIVFALSFEENPLLMFFRMMPYWLDWISFYRYGSDTHNLKVYRTERLARILNHG